MIGIPGAIGAVAMVLVEPYRLARVTSFLNPFADAQGDGWQIVQSLYAIGSGGLFGVGLGKSRQKYLSLRSRRMTLSSRYLPKNSAWLGPYWSSACLSS